MQATDLDLEALLVDLTDRLKQAAADAAVYRARLVVAERHIAELTAQLDPPPIPAAEPSGPAS